MPRDDLGHDMRVSRPPERVISLVPSLTEALAHEARDALVGATDYCVHPADLDVTRVGGSKYPDVDAVLRLGPDLVIANSEENRPGDVAALRERGVAVWVTAAPATVAAATGSLRRMFRDGVGVAAPDWLDEVETIWQPVEPAWATAVVPVWRRPWVVLGRDTFAGDVLRHLGVENAYARHPDRYPRPSLVELRQSLFSGAADLLLLPDEPYFFTETDGPDAFPGVRYALVPGRYLTWYGPSLLAGRGLLADAVRRSVPG
jgi:ABC-type Fe3+-hydroxamate transport system substrate-binding protein